VGVEPAVGPGIDHRTSTDAAGNAVLDVKDW
jgi:hypothetical protein